MMKTASAKNIVMNGMRKSAKWCLAQPFLALAVYLIVISSLFFFFPSVDLWVTKLFYMPGGGFPAEGNRFLNDFRHLGPFVVQLVAITCIAVLLLKLLVPSRPPLLPLRQPLFLLSTLIIGPGILVNLILKDHWGRPRPRMVDLFGGDMPYQPVWKISAYCDSNCSFVSGEASSAIWLVAPVLLLPPAWRRPALWLVLPLCFLLSANRVAFGGHFLSDTLLSWGLTLLVIAAVYRLLYQMQPPPVSDRGLDVQLTRAGRKLQAAVLRMLVRMRRVLRGTIRVFSER